MSGRDPWLTRRRRAAVHASSFLLAAQAINVAIKIYRVPTSAGDMVLGIILSAAFAWWLRAVRELGEDA